MDHPEARRCIVPSMKGIQEDLAALQDSRADMHTRLFLLMPIIEEIVQEKVPDIWVVRGSNTAARIEESNRLSKKINKSKKRKKKDVEATKAGSI